MIRKVRFLLLPKFSTLLFLGSASKYLPTLFSPLSYYKMKCKIQKKQILKHFMAPAREPMLVPCSLFVDLMMVICAAAVDKKRLCRPSRRRFSFSPRTMDESERETRHDLRMSTTTPLSQRECGWGPCSNDVWKYFYIFGSLST